MTRLRHKTSIWCHQTCLIIITLIVTQLSWAVRLCDKIYSQRLNRFLCFCLVYCSMRDVKGEVWEIESALSLSARCVKTVLIYGYCPFFWPQTDARTLSVAITFSVTVFHQSHSQTGRQWQVAHISPAWAKWASKWDKAERQKWHIWRWQLFTPGNNSFDRCPACFAVVDWTETKSVL